jgi:hypothetical protein
MAVVGRVLFSTVIDRLNQRLASAISFASQAVALLIVINSHNEMLLMAACALFGFSVGNLITLPSLILQREFDSRAFGVLISLITAINQITYAFGPGVIGLLRDASGSHDLPFYVCIGLELTAAVLIVGLGHGSPVLCEQVRTRTRGEGRGVQQGCHRQQLQRHELGARPFVGVPGLDQRRLVPVRLPADRAWYPDGADGHRARSGWPDDPADPLRRHGPGHLAGGR